MPSREVYKQQLIVNGDTRRKRSVNQMKRNLEHIIEHPSCKDVLVNGISDKLVILDTDNNRVKKYNALPNKTYSTGYLIDYANYKWLITDINEDSEVYQSGELKQCNHLFRFQNNTSEILECWGVVENPYSTSLEENKVMTVRGNKLKAFIPYNNDTKNIFIDKRLFMEAGRNSNGKEIPIVYQVVDIVTATENYGNGKIIAITLEIVGANENDSLSEKIADYISPETQPTQPDTSVELFNCVVSGSDILKAGGSSRKYEAIFYQSDGITIDTTIIPVWNIVSCMGNEDYYHTSVDENCIYISADDNDSIIGDKITLQLSDSVGLYNSAEFYVEVVSAF